MTTRTPQPPTVPLVSAEKSCFGSFESGQKLSVVGCVGRINADYAYEDKGASSNAEVRTTAC